MLNSPPARAPPLECTTGSSKHQLYAQIGDPYPNFQLGADTLPSSVVAQQFVSERGRRKPSRAGRREREVSMIIWVNGAYGVGKTTIAAELVKRRPGALLYDSEPLGYYLRDLVKPVEKAKDYQELAVFAPVVVEVARQLRQQYPRQVLIMPLGVWQPATFAEIHGGLEQIDGQVKHYCLTAIRQEINRRLLYRGDSPQAQRWIRERLDSALEALSSPLF